MLHLSQSPEPGQIVPANVPSTAISACSLLSSRSPLPLTAIEALLSEQPDFMKSLNEISQEHPFAEHWHVFIKLTSDSTDGCVVVVTSGVVVVVTPGRGGEHAESVTHDPVVGQLEPAGHVLV